MFKIRSLTAIVLGCLALHTLNPIIGGCEVGKNQLKSRIEVLTDAPLHLGIGALFEGPKRIRVSSSLGWMPNAYVQGANSIVRMCVPTYTAETAQLVEDTIQNSLVWRVHGGWRPFKNSGFYTHLGYTLVGLGGGSTAQSLIEGITGIEASMRESRSERNNSSIEIAADATLHLFDLELGWEWSLLNMNHEQSGELILRAALGWSYTFTSSARLDAGVGESQPLLQSVFGKLETAGELYLIDTFESYIHPPTVTLALGYQW